MRTIAFALFLACAADSLPDPATAQQSLGVGPIMGGSLDKFGPGDEGSVAFTFRRSRLTGAGPGEDLAAWLFPAGLAAGVVLIGVVVGAMQTVALGPFGLFVRGGASGIAAVDLHGGAAILPGIEGGFGALVRLDRRTGFRVDVTRHSFYSGGEHYGIWSVGLGFAVLPHAAEN
jgi:hypothetical protein